LQVKDATPLAEMTWKEFSVDPLKVLQRKPLKRTALPVLLGTPSMTHFRMVLSVLLFVTTLWVTESPDTVPLRDALRTEQRKSEVMSAELSDSADALSTVAAIPMTNTATAAAHERRVFLMSFLIHRLGTMARSHTPELRSA
jgi:hypothetical protein